MTYIKNIIYQPKRKIQYIFIITKENIKKNSYYKQIQKNNKNISKKKFKKLEERIINILSHIILSTNSKCFSIY